MLWQTADTAMSANVAVGNTVTQKSLLLTAAYAVTHYLAYSPFKGSHRAIVAYPTLWKDMQPIPLCNPLSSDAHDWLIEPLSPLYC